MEELKHVVIYTDGACTGNPGPGGYGVVLLHGIKRRELSGGFRLTTNNRMELMAVIVGLETLRFPCRITLYTDSKYVQESIEMGWAQQWRKNGWKKKKGKVYNPDSWERLLALCDVHQITFSWVRGHDGNIENERCDKLSVEATKQQELLVDEGYENEQNVEETPTLFD